MNLSVHGASLNTYLRTIVDTGLNGPSGAEAPLIERRTERFAGLGVAVGMEVLDTKPFPLLVYVANHLLMAHLRLELHSFVAVHAIDLTTRLDKTSHRSRDLFDLGGGLRSRRSFCHAVLSATERHG